MNGDQPEPVLRYATIGLVAAQQVLGAATDEAHRLGVPVCVAVVGHDGQPKLAARMDGAPQLSVSIAADKAYTVAAFGGMPTHQWWSLICDEPALLHGITKTPRLIVFGGGIPLAIDGELVGAVGVSGGSAEQDRQIAESAAGVLKAGPRSSGDR